MVQIAEWNSGFSTRMLLRNPERGIAMVRSAVGQSCEDLGYDADGMDKGPVRDDGEGRRAKDLAFALLNWRQGAAILAHALGDASVVKQAVRRIGQWIDHEAEKK
jgi:hypothetical protein